MTLRSMSPAGTVCTGAMLAAFLASAGTCTEPCEKEAAFYLDAAGDAYGYLELRVNAGETAEFEVTARMATYFSDDSAAWGFGAWGWSLSVAHDRGGLEIIAATTSGTDAGDLYSGGFVKTQVVENETGTGFVSARVLSIENPIHFPPVGDLSLVRGRYRFTAPTLTSSGAEISTTIRYQDGLRDAGQPIQNRVYHAGDTIEPCTEQLLEVEIHVAAPLDFFRGDANFDQVLDTSDPVTILGSLFHGDAVVRCNHAADSKDDGRVDTSDAVQVFGYLFLGGPEPPAPFPEPGSDPTPDALGCEPR